MIYVALLRGINVGGNNKIDMKLLKLTFERVGMKSVKTYINSGNIIFINDGLSKTKIVQVLEKAIYLDFGLQIKIVVRSFNDFKLIMKALPASWKNDQDMKSDVLFLWDDIDDELVLQKVVVKPEIDKVIYVTGAILWSVDTINVTKSGKAKLIGTVLYKKMTIRNVNTTRKIYELMQSTVSCN